MARRKQNPIKDIGNQVGSWLGGAARAYADITDRSRDVQPGRLPQVQAALDATRAIGKVVDTATGGFGGAVVSDAQRMAKTGSSTPSALYKTAAVNLAAGAVGAKAAQVAGRAVAATGIPARVVNKLTGETVIVHGTPHKLVGKTLNPTRGSRANPDEVVLFGWNPKSKNAYGNLERSAAQYSRVSGRGDYVERLDFQRNVVIAKVKKSKTDLGKPGSNPDIIQSSAPAKIVSVVKAPKAGEVSEEVYRKQLHAALRKAGAPIGGKTSAKVGEIKRKIQYARSNRRSTA